MTDRRRPGSYRDEIASTLRPVRPLAPPSKRSRLLIPLGLLTAWTAPLISGVRGDLLPHEPLMTWGVTAAQAFVGLWLLTLALRESVPGRNLRIKALSIAAITTGLVLGMVTVSTNAASPTVLRPGRELIDWLECVGWPSAIGLPLMIVATLTAARAFPTRPAINGALCGLSAGVLSDSGWRLACWISSPMHIVNSHIIAIAALTLAGAALAVWIDKGRWRRLTRT